MDPVPGSCSVSFERDGRTARVTVTGNSATIGRAPDCDVVIGERGVSRMHARITLEDGAWKLTDLDSVNGTSVNGERISEASLRDGDRILLGQIPLTVSIAAETDADEAPAETDDDGASVTAFFSLQDLGHTFASMQPARSTASLGGDRASATDPLGVAVPRHADEAPFAEAWAVELFQRTAQALLESDSLDEVLQRILDVAFALLPAERGLIGLYDADAGRMTTRVTRDAAGRAAEEIEISRKIRDQVVSEKRSLVFRKRDDYVPAPGDTFGHSRALSAVCAPLYHEDEVRGLLYLDSRDERKRFDEGDLKVLTLLALFAAIGIKQMRFEDEIQEQRKIRARLERYSSPPVVDRVIQPTAFTKMIAEERIVTVLFGDLDHFTTISEKMSPAAVALMLNQIFEQLAGIVEELEGTLDKFTGDGLMVFFGAPLEQPDHAERGISAAWRMREAVDELSHKLTADLPLTMRFGVNTGPVVVGDIGSEKRKDYTIIGDTVNVASRLAYTTAKAGEIIIGRPTYEAVKAKFSCRALPVQAVKGRREMVEPFAVEKQR